MGRGETQKSSSGSRPVSQLETGSAGYYNNPKRNNFRGRDSDSNGEQCLDWRHVPKKASAFIFRISEYLLPTPPAMM
jgi:hypothetical protein